MRYRTETYQHTINGLLQQRAEMLSEAAELRERLAAVSNDITSLDRALEILGYEGDLAAMKPRQARVVMFYRNELRQFILNALRDAKEPLSSRDIAERICKAEGRDIGDRRISMDIVKRVGRAVRRLQASGAVRASRDAMKRSVWRLGTR
jgi:hypothetical protein